MKKFLFGSAALILVMAALFFGNYYWQCSRLPQYMKNPLNTEKEVGRQMHRISVKKETFISVYYPKFFHANIDSTIHAAIDDLVDEFKHEKGRLYIDYSSYDLMENYCSVLLTIDQNGVVTHKAWVFDLEEDEIITMHDIFSADVLSKLEALIEYEEKGDQEAVSSLDDLKNYYLSNQELILFFEHAEEKRVAISLALLKPWIQPSFSYLLIEDSNVRIIDPTKPMIALTYDDGPHPEVTERILNVLKENNSAATFFVLGSRIASHHALIERMIKEGSEIGNHTFGHQDMRKLDKRQLNDQIGAWQDALKEVDATYQMKLVRPTYGATNDFVVKNTSYPLILWSIDTMDWSKKDCDYVVEKVLKEVKDGSVILMHDMYDSTAEATEILVPELIKRGYQCVTISELFNAKGIELEAGHIYHEAN